MSTKAAHHNDKASPRKKATKKEKRSEDDYLLELPMGRLADVPMPFRFIGLDIGKIFQKGFMDSLDASISKPMMFIVKVNCAGDDPFTDTLILSIMLVGKEAECIVLPAPDIPYETIKEIIEPLGGREAPMRDFDAMGLSY